MFNWNLKQFFLHVAAWDSRKESIGKWNSIYTIAYKTNERVYRANKNKWKCSTTEHKAKNIDFSIHVNYHLFLFHPTFAQEDYTLTTGNIFFIFSNKLLSNIEA